jgi:hypothetical protein
MSSTTSSLRVTPYSAPSILSQIYDHTVGNVLTIVSIPQSALGAVIRDAFFFPLKWSVIANIKSVRNQLEIEEQYSRDFWNAEKPTDPNLKHHAQIREKFEVLEEHLSIRLPNGTEITLTYVIIQTKGATGSCYNFVHLPGIFTTIYNNIGTIHPYLAAYLDAQQSCPARFFMISENNLNYKPATLDEAGWILLETLRALKAKFGTIDQLDAHSLGVVFMANSLKQVDDPAVLPQNIHFRSGPVSIYESSKKYFWGAGRMLYYLAAFGGWSEDLEEDIITFYKKWPKEKRPFLMISGVVQDHHFGGTANLCCGQKIKKLDIDRVVFDPPRQVVHEHAHHNLRSDLLNSVYVIEGSSMINPGETLPQAVLRHSFRNY